MTTHANERALRIIAAYKFVKCAGLIIVACVLFGFTNEPFLDKVADMVENLPIQTGRHILQHWMDQLTDMTPDKFVLAGVAACVYAALFLIEGFGLWTGKRWAEYLTTIATASLVPFEIYELVRRATLAKSVVLVANIAIVIYLIYLLRRGQYPLRGEPPNADYSKPS
ncbi:MAG TPA: DUF2127 domain-containing protein [Rudaea sp.]|nr:DUF2127 domain-containing protein [Rudaea sp.]